MKKVIKLLIMIIMIFAIPAINITAQEEDEDMDNGMFDKSFWEDDFNTTKSISQPAIEVMYGMGTPEIHKDAFSAAFNDVNSMEVRLGFNSKKEKMFSEDIYEYGFTYFFLGNILNIRCFSFNILFL